MKKQKKSFAEVLKEGRLLVEIRASDPDIQLEQEDFDHIDAATFFALPQVREVKDNMTEEESDWKIEFKGVAHGACWYSCANDLTVENWTKVMKLIQPPEDKNYTYVIYGPNNRPYRYFTIRVPRLFLKYCNNDMAKLTNAIKGVNPCLTKTFFNKEGEERKCHFKVLKVLDGDKRSDKPKDDPKYCILRLEVEELLFQPLIEAGGEIRVGMSPYQVRGGGIMAAIRKQKEVGTVAAVKQLQQPPPEDMAVTNQDDD